jgi:hypothetical protein
MSIPFATTPLHTFSLPLYLSGLNQYEGISLLMSWLKKRNHSVRGQENEPNFLNVTFHKIEPEIHQSLQFL